MRFLLAILFALPLSAAPALNSGGQPYEFGANIGASRPNATNAVNNAKHYSANSGWSLVLRNDGTLFAWGRNNEGQTNVPAGTTYTHCYAGWRHGIACKSDGTIVEWGTPFGNDIPTWEGKRPANLSGAFIVMVSAGDNHSAAMDNTGKVYIWGGTSATTNYNEVITDAAQILSTWYNMNVLLQSGRVTNFGHLGKTGQYLHANEASEGTYVLDAIAIGVSQFTHYAIRADGTMRGWGMPNNSGQFTALEGATNLVMISGGVIDGVNLNDGTAHTIALRADGTVFSWGDNGFGQTNVPAGYGSAKWVMADRTYSGIILGTPELPEEDGPSVAITGEVNIQGEVTIQ